MNQIRWSTLTLCPGVNSPSNLVGTETVESGTGTGCRIVDEFVLDPSRGTVATLEAPPTFNTLWSNGNSCSHPFPAFLAGNSNGNSAHSESAPEAQ